MNLPVYYDDIPVSRRWKVREEYIRLQGGKCSFCRAPLDGDPPEKIMKKKVWKSQFPSGFFDSPIHLHHDHKTGMTKGAVHSYCNAVLWTYHGE